MPNRLLPWFAAFLLAAFIGDAAVAADATPEPPAATAAPPVAPPRYEQDIQPIFNRRCIACHGCLGSPCNLKLDSFAGLTRGAFGLNPYASHLGAYPRTDMDTASSLEQWRKIGFFPVVAQGGSARENLDGSLLYRLLAAGTANNQPGFAREALTPFYANRFAHACPATPAALADQLGARGGAAGTLPAGALVHPARGAGGRHRHRAAL